MMELKEIVDLLKQGQVLHIVIVPFSEYTHVTSERSWQLCVYEKDDNPIPYLTPGENITLEAIRPIEPLWTGITDATREICPSCDAGFKIVICDRPFRAWKRTVVDYGHHEEVFHSFYESRAVRSLEELRDLLRRAFEEPRR